jgi:hypothetical protein
VVGVGERPVSRRLVAERRIDEDVVRHFVPDRRSAGRQSALRTGDRGQLFIFHVDRLRRIQRLRQSFGHHHRDGLANVTHPVYGEQRLRAKENRATAGSGQLQIVAGRRHRAVRDRPEAICEAVPAAEPTEDTRHIPRPVHLNFEDSRMRVGRADYDCVGLSWHAEVIGEPALAGQQPLIFLAANRLADCAKGHRRNVDRIVHARYLLDAVEREIENVEIA